MAAVLAAEVEARLSERHFFVNEGILSSVYMILMIGGHPRSGTTLLQTLCHAHPDIGMTNEFGNLVALGSSRADYTRHIFDRWRRVQGNLAFDISYHGAPWQMKIGNMGFALRHLYYFRQYCEGVATAVSIEAAYRAMYPNAKIYGDKWPHYLFRMGKYVKEDNLARLVIYRDCRDVTSSFLVKARTSWKNRAWVQNVDSAEKIAAKWVRGIEIMETHTDKLIILQYETLMREPEKELRRVSEALGLDPASFPDGMIDPGSIGKYQSGLTPEELETVLEVAGPTMARLGYLP